VGPIHQSSSHLSLCAWDPSLFFFLSHARAVVVSGASSNSDSSNDRQAWRGNVVARRLRQSTTAAVRANVHRHLHCSPHYLLPLHTPPPPPVAAAFPSLISIHSRCRSARTSRRTASPPVAVAAFPSPISICTLPPALPPRVSARPP
jgi:hypothetical protein